MTRLQRQSFLGSGSEERLWELRVGIVGLGGGGSHEAQQLAHVGVGRYVLVDPDTIDLTNTNRLVGGTLADVRARRPKFRIAQRVVRGLNPKAEIKPIKDRWQKAIEELKGCDVILGAVDSFIERDQLERFCRRFLIPYIDIGMDVLQRGEGDYLVSGQVILSMPGGPCMWCCGFLSDEKLEEEAKRYGAAGERPQVVWPNGVLASTAVGLLVGLATPWHPSAREFVYLVYDGNRGTVVPSPWMASLVGCSCPHHPADEAGDPGFDVRHIGEGERARNATARHSAWWRRFAGMVRRPERR